MVCHGDDNGLEITIPIAHLLTVLKKTAPRNQSCNTGNHVGCEVNLKCILNQRTGLVRTLQLRIKTVDRELSAQAD